MANKLSGHLGLQRQVEIVLRRKKGSVAGEAGSNVACRKCVVIMSSAGIAVSNLQPIPMHCLCITQMYCVHCTTLKVTALLHHHVSYYTVYKCHHPGLLSLIFKPPSLNPFQCNATHRYALYHVVEIY